MNLLRIILITIGIISLSSALPISLPTESNTSKWIVGSIFLLGAALITVGGCLCCKRKKGFKEFNNEPGTATHIVSAESPFPIFRPLNQSQQAQNGAGENQSEVTPLKHPDSPVLSHNNVEPINSGSNSQISNDNSHLLNEESIISSDHTINIEAPSRPVNNIASIRSNMQIISNAIINIVTNDHMEIDNNNGPISELDIQNIANNNAEGYIQNQNEIYQNQNLVISNNVNESYQTSENGFINFNQNCDVSTAPSTSGQNNISPLERIGGGDISDIHNDIKCDDFVKIKSHGDTFASSDVPETVLIPSKSEVEKNSSNSDENLGTGDDVNEALRCLESVLSGESDCESGSCSSLAEVQLEFNNDHFDEVCPVLSSTSCDNQSILGETNIVSPSKADCDKKEVENECDKVRSDGSINENVKTLDSSNHHYIPKDNFKIVENKSVDNELVKTEIATNCSTNINESYVNKADEQNPGNGPVKSDESISFKIKNECDSFLKYEKNNEQDISTYIKNMKTFQIENCPANLDNSLQNNENVSVNNIASEILVNSCTFPNGDINTIEENVQDESCIKILQNTNIEENNLPNNIENKCENFIKSKTNLVIDTETRKSIGISENLTKTEDFTTNLIENKIMSERKEGENDHFLRSVKNNKIVIDDAYSASIDDENIESSTSFKEENVEEKLLIADEIKMKTSDTLESNSSYDAKDLSKTLVSAQDKMPEKCRNDESDGITTFQKEDINSFESKAQLESYEKIPETTNLKLNESVKGNEEICENLQAITSQISHMEDPKIKNEETLRKMTQSEIICESLDRDNKSRHVEETTNFLKDKIIDGNDEKILESNNYVDHEKNDMKKICENFITSQIDSIASNLSTAHIDKELMIKENNEISQIAEDEQANWNMNHNEPETSKTTTVEVLKTPDLETSKNFADHFLSKNDSIEKIIEDNVGFNETQVFRTSCDIPTFPALSDKTFSIDCSEKTPSPDIVSDHFNIRTSTPSKNIRKPLSPESKKPLRSINNLSPRKPNYDFLKNGEINLESWDKFLGDSFERSNEDDDSVFDDCDKDKNVNRTYNKEAVDVQDLADLTGDEFFLVPQADSTANDSLCKDISDPDDNKENIRRDDSLSESTDSDVRYHTSNSDEDQDGAKLAEIRRALILSLPDAQGPKTKEDMSDYESGTKSAQNTPDNVQSQKRSILGVLEPGTSTSFPFPDYYSVSENEGTSEERSEVYIRYNAAGPLSPILEDWIGEDGDDKSHLENMIGHKVSSSDSICQTFIVNESQGSTSYSDKSAALTSDKPRQVLGSWCSNDTLFNVEDALDAEKITSPAENANEEATESESKYIAENEHASTYNVVATSSEAIDNKALDMQKLLYLEKETHELNLPNGAIAIQSSEQKLNSLLPDLVDNPVSCRTDTQENLVDVKFEETTKNDTFEQKSLKNVKQSCLFAGEITDNFIQYEQIDSEKQTTNFNEITNFLEQSTDFNIKNNDLSVEQSECSTNSEDVNLLSAISESTVKLSGPNSFDSIYRSIENPSTDSSLRVEQNNLSQLEPHVNGITENSKDFDQQSHDKKYFEIFSDSGVQHDISNSRSHEKLSVACANMINSETIKSKSKNMKSEENIIEVIDLLKDSQNALDQDSNSKIRRNSVTDEETKPIESEIISNICEKENMVVLKNYKEIESDFSLDKKVDANVQVHISNEDSSSNVPVKKYLIKKSDTKLDFSATEKTVDIGSKLLNGTSNMYYRADDDNDENSISDQENEDTISSNSDDYDTLTSSSQSGQEYELQGEDNEFGEKANCQINDDESNALQECTFNLDGENDPWLSSNIKFSESDIMTTLFSSESPMLSPQTNDCVETKFEQNQQLQQQNSIENMDDDTGCESEDTSEEFEWKSGDHQEQLKIEENEYAASLFRSNESEDANLDTTLIEEETNCDSHEKTAETSAENVEDDQEYDNDDDNSSDGSEEIEFIPSVWNSSAVPSRSSLKSPENNTGNKEGKSVVFKKEKYLSVYEYPKEQEHCSYIEPMYDNSLAYAPNGPVLCFDRFFVTSTTLPFNEYEFYPTNSDTTKDFDTSDQFNWLNEQNTSNNPFDSDDLLTSGPDFDLQGTLDMEYKADDEEQFSLDPMPGGEQMYEFTDQNLYEFGIDSEWANGNEEVTSFISPDTPDSNNSQINLKFNPEGPKISRSDFATPDSGIEITPNPDNFNKSMKFSDLLDCDTNTYNKSDDQNSSDCNNGKLKDNKDFNNIDNLGTLCHTKSTLKLPLNIKEPVESAVNVKDAPISISDKEQIEIKTDDEIHNALNVLQQITSLDDIKTNDKMQSDLLLSDVGSTNSGDEDSGIDSATTLIDINSKS